MYVEKYCKYKNEKITLNESSTCCICANCEHERCMVRNDAGTHYAYRICSEYATAKLDPDYAYEKERMCRICLDITHRLQNSG